MFLFFILCFEKLTRAWVRPYFSVLQERRIKKNSFCLPKNKTKNFKGKKNTHTETDDDRKRGCVRKKTKAH